MAILLQHTDESAHWSIWKIDETIDELLLLLPRRESYAERIAAFRTEHRKLEWLSVRVLLYQLLGQEKEIAYTPSGKPYLSDHSCQISISHTKGYVAVILSTLNEVGIDIEQYGSRVHKVAHKFMRDDEVALAHQGDDTWGLLLHWSAKEVMFKCMDIEGVDFREHLRIEPIVLDLVDQLSANHFPQGSFKAQEYKTERQRHFLIHYLIYPDFVLTWQVDLEVM